MGHSAKWLIAALSLSLMVNVFAAGHLFGGARFGPKQDKSRIEFARGVPRGAVKAMPDKARKAFRVALKEALIDQRQNRKNIRRLRATLPDLIAAPGDLNVAGLQERFTQLRRLNVNLQSGFETALIAALQEMTPEERAQFAAALKKGGRRGGGDRPPPPMDR